MEGGKWYGFHLGPARTPAVEEDPRHMPPNFYYSQQDWLELAAARHGFTWSALRPEGVCGFAVETRSTSPWRSPSTPRSAPIPVEVHRVAAVRLVGSGRGEVLEARLPHAAGAHQ
jgi:hypothetical protein